MEIFGSHQLAGRGSAMFVSCWTVRPVACGAAGVAQPARAALPANIVATADFQNLFIVASLPGIRSVGNCAIFLVVED
jgi:hypothetical protein